MFYLAGEVVLWDKISFCANDACYAVNKSLARHKFSDNFLLPKVSSSFNPVPLCAENKSLLGHTLQGGGAAHETRLRRREQHPGRME